jgi:hypothetical protein
VTVSDPFVIARTPEPPPSFPIGTAPRADGTTLPPILLWDGEWIIGCWCERGWCEWISGRRIEPTAWAPLPQERNLAGSAIS